jgi:hypothetical protein
VARTATIAGGDRDPRLLLNLFTPPEGLSRIKRALIYGVNADD